MAASRFFAHGLSEQAQAEDAAHRQVLDALPGDGLVPGLRIEVGLHAGQADDQEHHEAAQRQEDAVFGGGIGPALVLFAKALAQHGVHAHTGAHAHRDHHVLQRERQRYGGESVLADMGHEHRVHHVVKRLHQHGDHHGHTELYQQGVDLHGAHDVFPRFGGRGLGLLCFHDCSF